MPTSRHRQLGKAGTMAGDWIKMRCELGHDPDVIQIGAILNIDEFAVVGRLHAVWSWLDQHSETGTNVRIVTAYLDRLTACPGFAEAMRTVGWLSGRDGNLTFPGYENHNGETAKRRASETKRKQKQREQRENCPAQNGTNVPESPGPEKRREEKRREKEKKGAVPAQPTPPPANEWSEPLDPSESRPLVPLAAAISHGPFVQLTEEEVTHWWHIRNAAGWTRGTEGGGHPRKITSWQSDLKSSTSWIRESIAKAKNQPSHRAAKAQREYPETFAPLPDA